MNMMYFILIFFHVICAAFWTGGKLFLPLLVLSGIKENIEQITILYKTKLNYACMVDRNSHPVN